MMFVPYDGQSMCFDLVVSAQRKYSAQKSQRTRREKAAKVRLRETESHVSTPWIFTSPKSPYYVSTTDDEDESPPTYSPPQAHFPAEDTAPIPKSGAPNVVADEPLQLDHHESLALTISSKLKSISSRDTLSGGLRTDPFQSYPIKWREYFPAVVDFCREVVAPRPGYFRFLMVHDVLFEAIVTYILCVMPNKTSQTKVAIMYHYGCTLSKVGRLLSSDTERASDAMILAIANLAVICVSSTPAGAPA